MLKSRKFEVTPAIFFCAGEMDALSLTQENTQIPKYN